MAPKTIPVDEELARQIKQRRLELGLSIEEAASRAGVGAKTWGKYESGQAIRYDKAASVCKVLKWKQFPDDEAANCSNENAEDDMFKIGASHESWSQYLNDQFGYKAAVSFAFGTDILLDYLDQDIEQLSACPRGTHIGEINGSWMADLLPAQYLTRYDYEFLFRLRANLIEYRMKAKHGLDLTAHTVAEELLVRLIRDASFDLVSNWNGNNGYEKRNEAQPNEDWTEWPEEICGDDFTLFINVNSWTPKGDQYSFENWFKPQFYLD